MSLGDIVAGIGLLGAIVAASIYVGGYRQMVENQRRATARAFARMKSLSTRLRAVEAALYSEKILRQPTETGDADGDDEEP